MKEKRSLHLKVQEFCDCFATTAPLNEMSKINDETDKNEACLKWLALTALHGVNANAKKITITRSPAGSVRVTAQYRDAILPAPDAEIASMVMSAVREITHLESQKGKTTLALGIRDSSIDLQVKVKSDERGDTVTLRFPE